MHSTSYFCILLRTAVDRPDDFANLRTNPTHSLAAGSNCLLSSDAFSLIIEHCSGNTCHCSLQFPTYMFVILSLNAKTLTLDVYAMCRCHYPSCVEPIYSPRREYVSVAANITIESRPRAVFPLCAYFRLLHPKSEPGELSCESGSLGFEFWGQFNYYTRIAALRRPLFAAAAKSALAWNHQHCSIAGGRSNYSRLESKGSLGYHHHQ